MLNSLQKLLDVRAQNLILLRIWTWTCHYTQTRVDHLWQNSTRHTQIFAFRAFLESSNFQNFSKTICKLYFSKSNFWNLFFEIDLQNVQRSIIPDLRMKTLRSHGRATSPANNSTPSSSKPTPKVANFSKMRRSGKDGISNSSKKPRNTTTTASAIGDGPSTSSNGKVSNKNKKRSKFYNKTCVEKPTELFRTDLISNMTVADNEPLNNQADLITLKDTWRKEWNEGVQVRGFVSFFKILILFGFEKFPAVCKLSFQRNMVHEWNFPVLLLFSSFFRFQFTKTRISWRKNRKERKKKRPAHRRPPMLAHQCQFFTKSSQIHSTNSRRTFWPDPVR